jgi:hypothetical protein
VDKVYNSKKNFGLPLSIKKYTEKSLLTFWPYRRVQKSNGPKYFFFVITLP